MSPIRSPHFDIRWPHPQRWIPVGPGRCRPGAAAPGRGNHLRVTVSRPAAAPCRSSRAQARSRPRSSRHAPRRWTWRWQVPAPTHPPADPAPDRCGRNGRRHAAEPPAGAYRCFITCAGPTVSWRPPRIGFDLITRPINEKARHVFAALRKRCVVWSGSLPVIECAVLDFL